MTKAGDRGQSIGIRAGYGSSVEAEQAKVGIITGVAETLWRHRIGQGIPLGAELSYIRAYPFTISVGYILQCII